MKDGVVYRQGRTVQISDRQKASENECSEMMCTFLGVMLPVLLLFHLYARESYFASQQTAFEAIARDGGVKQAGVDERPGQLIHLAASSFEGSVTDPQFNLQLGGGLKLSRTAEYCQWDESSTESCQTCTRRGSDGKDESYDCNCVRKYHYVKMWRSHRILSVGFDQPANHHNPMRDPAPSSSFISDNTVAQGFEVDSGVLSNLRAPMRRLSFSHNAVTIPPGLFESIFGNIFGHTEYRFQDIRALREFGFSDARRTDNFVYTNTREVCTRWNAAAEQLSAACFVSFYCLLRIIRRSCFTACFVSPHAC